MEEIGLTSETLDKVPEFIVRYANLQIEKKNIDADIMIQTDPRRNN